jgi:hypothetical protein
VNILTRYRKFESTCTKSDGLRVVWYDRASDGTWDTDEIRGKHRRDLALEFMATLPRECILGAVELPARLGGHASTIVYYRKPGPAEQGGAARGANGRVCRGTITAGRAAGARAMLLQGPAGPTCRVELISAPAGYIGDSSQLATGDIIRIATAEFDPDHTTERTTSGK